MILVYIIIPNKKTALKIIKYLLEKKLIACANFFKIESFYWWHKKIEKAYEYILIAKTINRNYSKIEKEIRKIHPYKIPCILKIKVEKANKDYLSWLIDVLK